MALLYIHFLVPHVFFIEAIYANASYVKCVKPKLKSYFLYFHILLVRMYIDSH